MDGLMIRVMEVYDICHLLGLSQLIELKKWNRKWKGCSCSWAHVEIERTLIFSPSRSALAEQGGEGVMERC